MTQSKFFHFIASFLLIITFSIGIPSLSTAQNRVAQWLETQRNTADFLSYDLVSISSEKNTEKENSINTFASDVTMLQVDQEILSEISKNNANTIALSIPRESEDNIELELAQVNLLSEDFAVGTFGEKTVHNINYQGGLHYRGIVKGNPNSLASVSIFDNQILMMVADETGNYQMTKMEDGTGNYILYNTSNVKIHKNFNCGTDDVLHQVQSTVENAVASDRFVGCKVVNIYFECDYKLYQDKGSNATAVSDYVIAFFNQVATLYANENIDVDISSIYVWTATDPYAALTNTSDVLTKFRTTRGVNFNGNIAHLLTTRNLGGGIAYIDVLCFKDYAHGVSMIYTTYSNVPTYSWTVEVVAHELGHSMGSWHTHSCNWTGGPIDNCYTQEGTCSPGPAPTNGGTIMSYCHLTGAGINMNHGFGVKPGDLLRSKVLNAACLSTTGTTPTGIAASNVTTTAATIGWSAVTGATNYNVQYKTSSATTWTTLAATTNTNQALSGLASGTVYNVQVKTNCSGYSPAINFTTTANSNCSAPTSLATTIVYSTSAGLTWAQVSGASTYTVEYKLSNASTWIIASSSVSSNSYTLSSLTAAKTYNWRIKANCSTYSSTASFTTLSSGACPIPTGLVNNTVTTTSANVGWSATSGASNYTVQYRISSSSKYVTVGTFTALSCNITGLQANKLYYWRVKANCSNYSDTKAISTPASLPNAGAENTFKMQVSPNPATEYVNINVQGLIQDGMKVIVSDITGRAIQTVNFELNGQSLNIEKLKSGIYFLTLMNKENKLTVSKFIKV